MNPYITAGLNTPKINLQYETLKMTDVTNLTLEKLFREVSIYCNNNTHTLKSKTRRREAVIARQLFFYVARKLFKGRYTLKNIGKISGGRDHSTVLHGIKTIEDLMSVDKSINNWTNSFIRKVTDPDKYFIIDIPRTITDLTMTQKQLFKEIWQERPHISEISGKPLYPIEHSQWHWQFAHVLNKGRYTKWKLEKRNIMLMLPEEHENQESYPYFQDRKQELKREYYEKENNS